MYIKDKIIGWSSTVILLGLGEKDQNLIPTQVPDPTKPTKMDFVRPKLL